MSIFLDCDVDFIALKRMHSKSEWFYQCCGSMTFWCGSGCGSRSCYFHHWPSRRKKTNFSKKVFLHITFWRYIFIIFQRQKVKKKSQNSRNQDFSYYPLTTESGSGSRRPGNTWIPWIRIRIQIRIHNTGFYSRYEFWSPCTVKSS